MTGLDLEKIPDSSVGENALACHNRQGQIYRPGSPTDGVSNVQQNCRVLLSAQTNYTGGIPMLNPYTPTLPSFFDDLSQKQTVTYGQSTHQTRKVALIHQGPNDEWHRHAHQGAMECIENECG